MAKKSTKTAHVLNLISKSTEQDPATQTEETQTIEQVQQSPTSPLLSSLKETAKNEQLSDTIKEHLMAELLEEEAENEKTTTQQEPVVMQEETTDTTVSEPVATPQNTEDTTVVEPIVETAPPVESVSEQPAASVADTAVQTPTDAVQTEMPSEPEKAEAPKDAEDEFHFINIGEMLIKDKVMEYMERFDVCTCSRCVADTMAIALSNLTPKYVVSDDSDVVPFLSYYESKFTNQIMTELTKACLTVSANPRHKTKS